LLALYFANFACGIKITKIQNSTSKQQQTLLLRIKNMSKNANISGCEHTYDIFQSSRFELFTLQAEFSLCLSPQCQAKWMMHKQKKRHFHKRLLVFLLLSSDHDYDDFNKSGII